MTQMKLGWWRARNGSEHKVDKSFDGDWPWWSSSSKTGWDKDGNWNRPEIETEHDLIEFICPLEDLPPVLNSAVKAAENMVRRLEQHHSALQNQANEACEILVQARRELERLEKECEVKS